MRSRSGRPIAVIALLTAGTIVTSCGSDRPSASAAASIEVPVASDSPSGSAAGGTQSESGWGRIWDNVPTGFPRFPGSTIADPVSPDPVSATYSVADGDTAQIAGWMQNALETASFGTESLSGPLEDGGFVIESVGEGECRIQTSVQPMGGLTFVIVRYGAACPAG